MTTEDYKYFTEIRNRTGNVSHDEYKMICEIHARVFNHDIDYVSKCPSCGYVQKYLDEINVVYENIRD